MRERLASMARLDRIMPLATILGAATALTANLIGALPLGIPDQILIALLGLLAIDSLTDRVLSLGRIERRLAELGSAKSGLLPRIQMPALAMQAAAAQELWFLAVHGTSAIPPNIAFLDRKLRAGAKIRIALLDPLATTAIDVFSLLRNDVPATNAIQLSLSHLGALSDHLHAGNLEVRLTPTFMPFSMLATDPTQRTGLMNVEFHAVASGIDSRPHVRLLAIDDVHWFEHFRTEFETMWQRARPWSGT